MREDTQIALDKFSIRTFGNLKNISVAEELIHADEKVLFVTPTNLVVSNTNTKKKDKFPGVVFLTDKRMVFHYKILNNFSMETVSLDEIRSLNCNGNSLSGGHVEVHTMTKSYDILVSYKQETIRQIQQVFEEARNRVNTPTGGSCGAAVSSADEILKFKNLLDSGVISPEEFETKKKQLLGI